jgi:hypothetical protein
MRVCTFTGYAYEDVCACVYALARSLLTKLAPIVEAPCGAYLPSTNLCTRHVFPTPVSPNTTTFDSSSICHEEMDSEEGVFVSLRAKSDDLPRGERR